MSRGERAVGRSLTLADGRAASGGPDGRVWAFGPRCSFETDVTLFTASAKREAAIRERSDRPSASTGERPSAQRKQAAYPSDNDKKRPAHRASLLSLSPLRFPRRTLRFENIPIDLDVLP